MDEVLKAIDKSIDKWKSIVLHRVDFEETACALCHELGGEGCQLCPLHIFTGSRGCFGTPYYGTTQWYESCGTYSEQLIENNRMLTMLYEVRRQWVVDGENSYVPY